MVKINPTLQLTADTDVISNSDPWRARTPLGKSKVIARQLRNSFNCTTSLPAYDVIIPRETTEAEWG